jgi:alkylhydroperoxidase family enzyme
MAKAKTKSRAPSPTATERELRLLRVHVEQLNKLVIESMAEVRDSIAANNKREVKEEKKMAKKISDILAEVEQNASDQEQLIAEQTSVIDGLAIYINGTNAQLAAVREELEELKASGGTPEQIAAFDAVIARVQATEDSAKANTARIAAAIAQNTPSQ